MFINDTSCCGMMEIGAIGEGYDGDPERLLADFCGMVWPRCSYSYAGKPAGERRFDIPPHAFYIFSGLTGYDDGTEISLNSFGDDDDEDFDEDHVYSTEVAPALADLIRRKALGRLIETKSERNRTNHPDHFIRVYVWAPDEEALRDWYKQWLPAHGEPLKGAA